MTDNKRDKRDPWIKFFLQDFTNDPRLKLCSRAARSFWLDCLRIMHEADPYGFLVVEGIFLTAAQVASVTGDRESDARKWMDELRRYGVPGIVGQPMPDDVRALLPHAVPEDAIFSRRMLRDANKKALDRANGKGGGNPKLTGKGLTPPVNPDGDAGLKPRSQKPESRRSPKPPSAGDNPPAVATPPPPRADGWDELAPLALARMRESFCVYSLFACRIVHLSANEVALEAPNKLTRSRVADESQTLHDLFGKTVKFTVAGSVA